MPLTLKKLGVKRQFDLHAVITHWPDIVGNDIALQSRPTSAKNGVLFIAVKTPVWGHHLSMLKDQLLAQIHKFIGQKLIDDIKFYAGNFQNYTNITMDEPDFATRLRTVAVDDFQRMEVKAIVHAVNDSKLRYRLQRLILKDKRRKKLLMQDGWRRCLRCSALCPPDEKYCTSCCNENISKKREEIRSLLTDAPWIDYREISKYIDCNEHDFLRAKQELMQSLLYKIDVNTPNRLTLSTLAMLVYKLTPEKLDNDVFEKTLRFIRRNRYVLASGR